MSHLDCLPRELFARILSIVRNSITHQAFLDCLLVCQQWQLICTPLLYTTLVLTDKKLRKFVTLDQNLVEKCGRSVRSLSIRISSIWIVEYTTDGRSHLKVPDSHADRLGSTSALRSNLRTLSEIIKSYMPLMTSFSLFVDHSSYGTLKLKHNTWDAGFGIGAEDLALLLKSLPSTCVSLELDTDGKDMHKADTTHLCPIIRDMMPRLRLLRLRLKYICPSLLYTNSSDNHEGTNHVDRSMPALDNEKCIHSRSLQSMIISLNSIHWTLWPWSFGRAELCSSLQGPPQTRRGPKGPVTMAARPQVPAGPEIIKACRKAISNSASPCAFSSLKRFEIYELEFDPDDDFGRANDIGGFVTREDGTRVFPEQVPDIGFRHTIFQRNILTDKIRATPMRRPDPAIMQETWGVRTMDGQEHFGDVDEIERLIEGPTWYETKNEHARLPAMVANSEDSMETGYQWQAVELQTREEFESRAEFDASRRQNEIPEAVVKDGMD